MCHYLGKIWLKQFKFLQFLPSLYHSDVTVNDVQPKLEDDAFVQEGISGDLAIDLDVLYANTRETTSVFGEGLWTTKLWMSTFEDGSNELPGTIVEEALTEGQQSQNLKKTAASDTFTINDIRYQFDLTDHTCDEAKYVCAKFNKGPDPKVEKEYLNFFFEARPSEDVLTGCTEILDCRGELIWLIVCLWIVI